MSCSGNWSCYYSDINGSFSNALEVSFSERDALRYADIFCPMDLKPKGSIKSCKIHSDGDSYIALTGTNIYAIESFYDVSIQCDTLNYYSFHRPKIYCTENYNINCEISLSNLTSNEWKCYNQSNLCNSYILPTHSPTIDPSLVLIVYLYDIYRMHDLKYFHTNSFVQPNHHLVLQQLYHRYLQVNIC